MQTKQNGWRKLGIQNDAVLQKTKKATKFGLKVFKVREEFILLPTSV